MFVHSPVLLLLVIPIALLLWIWRNNGQGHQVVIPVDESLLTRNRIWEYILKVTASLPALLLATAVFLLAGPQQLSDPKTKKRLTNI